jgi:hypothetical protein
METGIYKDMSDSDYNAIDAIRWSSLKHILDSPLAYKFEAEKPREDKDCFRFGRAFHAALLRPDVFADKHIVAPPEHVTKTGWSKKPAAQAWLADMGEDDLPVTEHELGKLEHMANRIAVDPDAPEWIRLCDVDQDGGIEVVAVWIETIEVDGVEVTIKCKAKADGASFRARMLMDAKTHQARGKRMSLRTIESTIGTFMYDAQLAYYARGFRAAAIESGLGADPFDLRTFIFAESVPPHDLACVQLDDDAVQEGDHMAEKALLLYARAKLTDTWPGCASGVEVVSLPRWRLPKNDDGSVADDLGLTGLEG